MNTQIYHLAVFIACIISLTIIIVTGHDNSPLVTQLAGGLFGGVMGGSAAGAAPLLAKLIGGGGPDTSSPARQGGFTRLGFLVFVLAVCAIAFIGTQLSGCASLTASAKADPVATACASSSVAIKTLTAAGQAHALSAPDAAAVAAGIATIAPVCDASPEPSPTGAAFTALLSATTSLQTVAAKYPTP